jgi:hypothetical protein
MFSVIMVNVVAPAPTRFQNKINLIFCKKKNKLGCAYEKRLLAKQNKIQPYNLIKKD